MTDTRFILVVEDDPILKNLLGHTFAGTYQTLYASDGNEALALFEQYKPSIVLLDLMLPTMDGFAVLETIRARTDESKNVPIIVVSNLGQDKDQERAKTLGATQYLVKAEVSIEEIVAKIQQILDAQLPSTAPVPALMAQVSAPTIEASPAPVDIAATPPSA
jgi:two-component system response regulator ResD